MPPAVSGCSWLCGWVGVVQGGSGWFAGVAVGFAAQRRALTTKKEIRWQPTTVALRWKLCLCHTSTQLPLLQEGEGKGGGRADKARTRMANAAK